jgi:hypothetical protein
MPSQMPCPSCRRLLNVPDAYTGVWLSCPLCLAEFVSTQPEPGAFGVQTARRAEAPAARSAWLRSPPVDREARGDQSANGWGLSALAMIGALGLFLWCFNELTNQTPAMQVAGLAFLPFVLLVGVSAALLAAILIVRLRRQGAPTREIGRRVGALLTRALAYLGCLFLVGLAMAILFFIACLWSMPSFSH